MSDNDQLTHAIVHLTRAIHGAADVRQVLDRIAQLESKLMITKEELVAGLKALTTQSGKIATEQSDRFDAVTKELVDLKAVIATGGAVDAEVETAFKDVVAAFQSLDEVIPDKPGTPPSPPVVV